VRPGLSEVRAIADSDKVFNNDDLPTLERPTNAISSNDSAGIDCDVFAPAKNESNGNYYNKLVLKHKNYQVWLADLPSILVRVVVPLLLYASVFVGLFVLFAYVTLKTVLFSTVFRTPSVLVSHKA
jgi:hypothetical protein